MRRTIWSACRSAFSLMFMGEDYSVRHPDFRIECVNGDLPVHPLLTDAHAQILMLRYLLNASAFEHNGDFRAYAELPSGDVYLRQFEGRCRMRFSRAYGNRPEALARAMARMGALPVALGDWGYELEIFENMYMRFALWAGDEDFPASAQILFSSNFPAAFGAYDLAELGEICINALRNVERALDAAE